MKTRALIIAIASFMSTSAMAQFLPFPAPPSNDDGKKCHTSHYYNHSSQPWRVSITPGSGTANFYGCAATPEGRCVVAPGKAVTAVGINFSVEIMDHSGRSATFRVGGKKFDASCPYIQHSGNTGSVAMNDPADGDMNMWANQW